MSDDEPLVSILARLARAQPRNADIAKAYAKALASPAKPKPTELTNPLNGSGYWALAKRRWRAGKKKPGTRPG